jgi:hypothetical protein
MSSTRRTTSGKAGIGAAQAASVLYLATRIERKLGHYN